ncbi:MAG: hypothetical protein AAF939_14340 [Planctomycetota bacterium]
MDFGKAKSENRPVMIELKEYEGENSPPNIEDLDVNCPYHFTMARAIR